MPTRPDIEALALLEVDSLPAAVRAQDAALKRAAVRVLACAPVSPGKAMLMFWGDVAAADESLAAADAAAGSQRIDMALLPAVHSRVVAAVIRSGRDDTSHALGHDAPRGAARDRGKAHGRTDLDDVCLAIVEFTTITAAIEAADAAVKCAQVELGRMHLASGYGGKAFFTLLGAQCDVEAACEAASQRAGGRLATLEIIAAPHAELAAGVFVRPWPVDPAVGR